MRPQDWTRLAIAGALAALLAGGCGPSDGRQKVSGTVTYKGQAVDGGSIEFLPPPGGASHAGATIENGQYTIAADKGLMPGTYTVKISWPEKQAAPPDPNEPPGDLGRPRKERLPAKYNAKTTLTCEVKPDGKNTIDFNLD